jgi:hypothetical protein
LIFGKAKAGLDLFKDDRFSSVPLINSVNVMVEMKGGNKNTFAKIPIGVKGLVFLDKA